MKNDIHKVNVGGRQLNCDKCNKLIEDKVAIKKRVYSDKDKRWQREYLHIGCYERATE